MNHSYDLLLVGALACVVVAIVTAWLSAAHEANRQAIRREIDGMSALRPADPLVHLGALPQQKYDELEARRLRLVVGGSSRGL